MPSFLTTKSNDFLPKTILSVVPGDPHVAPHLIRTWHRRSGVEHIFPRLKHPPATEASYSSHSQIYPISRRLYHPENPMPEPLVVAEAAAQCPLQIVMGHDEPIVCRTSAQYHPERLDYLELRAVAP